MIPLQKLQANNVHCRSLECKSFSVPWLEWLADVFIRLRVNCTIQVDRRHPQRLHIVELLGCQTSKTCIVWVWERKRRSKLTLIHLVNHPQVAKMNNEEGKWNILLSIKMKFLAYSNYVVHLQEQTAHQYYYLQHEYGYDASVQFGKILRKPKRKEVDH